MTKHISHTLLMVLLWLGVLSASGAKKVHTLGDSTMAPYEESATVTRGWGMYFGQFLTDGWASINYAKGGRDSYTGYSELWQTAKRQVTAGDYVIIQFAHNDEKNGGMDGYELRAYYERIGDQASAAAVDLRGSIPSTTYKANLRKIAQEALALGAHPVFVGPVCRSYFSGGKIRRNGRHDLGDNYSILTDNGPTTGHSLPANDHTMDYAYQMAQLAQEMELPYVDLTTATAQLYESYGDAKCHELLFDGEGSTHFNTTGALLVARTCAQLMQQQGLLADVISVPTDLSLTPMDGDFGQAYKGQTLQKEYTLSGFGLQPESGTVTISATEGLELSTDKKNWSSQLSIAYQAATLIQTFHARLTLAEAGTTTGTITISTGQSSMELPVTATAVTLDSGTEVEVYWRLENDDSYTLTGPATVVPQSWQGMYVQRYSNPNANTTWPEWTGFDASRKTQRNLLTGDAWPADEIDDNPARYIQWGIAPASGTTLSIDEISLFVCGCGGNGMCCHIYYSTDGFETRHTMFEMNKMPANQMQYVEAKPVIKLEEGQQLLVRVYPWYNGAATGKTICLSDLKFHGVATQASVTVDHQQAVATFPFDQGTEGQTATFSEGADEWFKNSYVDHGENLVLKDANSGQTRFQPTVSNEGKANDGNAITFYLIPKDGLTFTPTHVSFRTTRYGTDGGKVDVSWLSSDLSVTPLATGVIPARNNANPNVTQWSGDVSAAPASNGICGLRLNLYSLGDTKQVGFSDIVIQGIVNGTTIDVRQCLLVAKLENDAAGTLTITPRADVFSQGDEVTLTVTENFGWHFNAWVDSETGQVVSTQNPYTFSMAADTYLTATFTRKATYALDITLTDGARDNLVSVQPEGTWIDGRRMYEEGTDVRLTAQNNKILTFIGWEDQSTDAERTVRMDADRQLTAQFSAVDYIVGWDFYQDAPNQERAADYMSDTENAGLLSLHNAEGTTSTWLTRGVNNGAENGRWAARIWRLRSLKLYFEASFSTRGYKNVKVTSSLGCSYNTYSTNHLQYSIDGVNYQTVATFHITGSGWFDMPDVPLPADADEQDRVWVRWMPDFESPLVGAATDYDGLAISDIFITADAGTLADEQAMLVSSNPAAQATGVSANGSIILHFDKKIKAGQGVALLSQTDAGGSTQSVELQPIISGKSAVFKYTGLQYATNYRFTMPQGVLTSRSGRPVEQVDISFTTMQRSQPLPRLFDAVVAQDGTGDYTTVQQAIDAAPAGRATPWLIFVKNGRYQEHVDIPKTKPYMHLIGQSRDGVVITDNRLSGGDNAVHVSVGATVVVNASNTFIENLTMENSWGHEKQAGPQALALNTIGDRICMNHVRLLSYQDTWITTSTSNNRHYIRHSLIEGAVDFIYNSGNVFLDGDTLLINRPSGGFIVAPSHAADVKWGYVFMNNVIRPYPGMNVTDVWLGRPWHNQPKTVFINTQTFVNIPAAGWYETMGGLPALWADYNTIDANGNPVDLSQRRHTYYREENGQRIYGEAKNFLTDEEAAQYTVRNVCGDDDNWQPDLMCEACSVPVVTAADGRLTWQPVPYAICYVVSQGRQVVAFTTQCEYAADGAATSYTVQAVNEFGGLSQPGAVSTDDHVLLPVRAEGGQQFFTLDGKPIAQPCHGVCIVRHADGTVQKVVTL